MNRKDYPHSNEKTMNNSNRITSALSWASALPRRRGQADFIRFLKGKRNTQRQSIAAFCFHCSSGYDLGNYCHVTDCPLWPFNPYQREKNKADLSHVDVVGEIDKKITS